jgi:hypothetical protein
MDAPCRARRAHNQLKQGSSYFSANLYSSLPVSGVF